MEVFFHHVVKACYIASNVFRVWGSKMPIALDQPFSLIFLNQV